MSEFLTALIHFYVIICELFRCKLKIILFRSTHSGDLLYTYTAVGG